MLTIRFDKLGLRRGDRVLDVGAGFGRHAFEAARRGGSVVALDYAVDEVAQTRATVGAMVDAGEITVDDFAGGLRGDATRLPFADDSFDVVITSEVLEHIQDDVAAIAEMTRVLAPGGVFAATVPSWFPEKINWMLSDGYHAPKSVGGHVRRAFRAPAPVEIRPRIRPAAGRVVRRGLRRRGHGRALYSLPDNADPPWRPVSECAHAHRCRRRVRLPRSGMARAPRACGARWTAWPGPSRRLQSAPSRRRVVAGLCRRLPD